MSGRRGARTGGRLAVAGLTLALPLTVAGTPTAQAAFPGSNGTIAFFSHDASSASTETDIWTLDGTDLTPDPGPLDVNPAYGPSGHRLAWSRDLNIWVMSADGSNQQQLTDNAAYENAPSFSPDGTHIAYMRTGALWVMQDDGSHQHKVTDNGYSPSWSPNGHWIAFDASTTNGKRVFKIHPSGKGRTNLSGNPSGNDEDADWSPDGKQLVFSHYGDHVNDEDIWIMNADGTHRHGVVTTAPYQYAATFAPSGNAIAYVQDFTGSNGSDIWRMTLATGDRRNLTNTPGTTDDGPTWRPL